MSIVAKELIKVFTNKSVLFIFTLLIVLNGALLYVNEYTADLSYQPSAYKELHQDIKGLSNEDVLDKLEADYNELSFYLELMIDQNINSSQDSLIERYTDLDVPSLVEKYNNNSYLKYTDNYFFETELYRQVLEDANGIVNYDAYLKKIDDDAKIMTSVSIFVKPDTFAYRNIKKMPLDFSHLKGNRLSIDTSKGLKLATESLTTDIIALVLILAVCMTLITKEKEQDCLNLAKTTYRGRRPLAASKLVVAFISCAFIGLMLYSVNFAFGYFAYGFGDLGRYIQSLSGYIGSALNITVFQYLVLFLIAKLLVYMLISLIVLTVSILVNSSIGVYIVNVVIFGLSGILYYTIPATSVFSVFKYINIIAFLDTFKLFASYRNLNFFAMPVNYISCFILAVVAGLVLLSAISIALFSKQKSIRIAAR
ncbi:MAG TPA: hypothetical protein VFD33_08470, partial [Bacillota bacterium]|nr:hypothetical protein [Bacillota bacterium]